MTSQSTSGLNKAIFAKKGENSKYCYTRFKISKFYHFTFILKKGNGYSNTSCKFQFHSIKIVSKWGLEISEVATTPFTNLDGYPTPSSGVPLLFSSK